MSPRLLLLALLLPVVAAEARLLLLPPVIVVEPALTSTDPQPVGTGLESAFTAHMTADDVARGIYALAAPDAPLPLTAEQRATIGPLLQEGATLRARLGELRMTRRAKREAWLTTGTALASARPQ